MATSSRFRACAAPVLVFLALIVPGEAWASKGLRVWENVSLGLSTTDLVAVQILPNDPQVVLVGGSGFVFRTDDAGDSWSMVLRIARPTRRGARGSGGRATDDGGKLEERVEEIFRASFDEAEQRLGQAFAEGIEDRLRDEARQRAEVEVRRAAARKAQAAADNTLTAARPRDNRIRRIRAFAHRPGLFLVCTEQGLYRSLDGGRRFRQLPVLIGPRSRVVNDVVAIPASAAGPTHASRHSGPHDGVDLLALATEGGVVIREPGGAVRGATMPRRNRPVSTVLWHAPSGRILAAGEDGILASDDMGRTFRTLFVPSSAGTRRVRDLAYPSDAPRTLLVATDQGLFRSSDGGASFRRSWFPALGMSGVRRLAAPRGRHRLFLATDLGIFSSRDGGISVSPMYRGLPDRNVRDVSAVGDGRGLVIWVVTPDAALRWVAQHEVKVSRKLWLLLSRFRGSEPTLSKVLHEATLAFHMDPSIGRSMQRRVLLRSLGPILRVDHWRQDLRAERFALPSDPLRPFFGEEIAVVPGDLETRVTLALDLRDLVFDAQEIRVAEYQERAAKRRLRFRQRVARIYSTRQEVLLRLLSMRRQNRLFRKHVARVEMLTALLDGFTGHRLRWASARDLLDLALESRP